VGTVGVLNQEGLKIKSCKGVSGNKGWNGRVLVCSTFSAHLSVVSMLCGKQQCHAVDRTAPFLTR
jgi:hypothetical protein